MSKDGFSLDDQLDGILYVFYLKAGGDARNWYGDTDGALTEAKTLLKDTFAKEPPHLSKSNPKERLSNG